MKKRNMATIAALTLCLAANGAKKGSAHGYPIDPVPFTSVKVADGFWGKRLKAIREVTVPLAFSKCKESGRYDNFMKAVHPSDTIKIGGFPFDDTDVYKTIEGASYLLQTYPDKRMENYIDSVLSIVAAAQEPDGYLYTARTMNPKHPHSWAGSRRWEKVEDLSHEFYNLGHMVEGAIAHYQATGKRNFLDIAIRYADCICRAIGDGEGQVARVPGHQIAEMALAKLYLVTGDRKYLDQAKYFLDKRGYTSRKDEYSQAHKPVTEQEEAVGHAVRAVYMYSGMADVAALTGDSAYIRAIDRIWDNMVGKKLYITGGIGARHQGESFGDNYELPNASAYCETCAAIGNVYMNHRLFLLHGDSKYYDVLERTLYNGLISGMSVDGGAFFYPNPLESHGEHQRQPWFGCACCPSNLSRFIPSLPGYVYAVKGDDVYVNLFMSNTADLDVAGKKVKLTQSTSYPWDGDVTITVDRNSAGPFDMKIRIPGWARGVPVPSDLYIYEGERTSGYSVSVNGQPLKGDLDNGYLTLSRKWRKGDKVEIRFDMKPRVVKANQGVKDDKGKVAFERGPIVYCAEWPDNDFDINSVLVSRNPKIKTVERPDLLNGLIQLTTDVQTLSYDRNGNLSTDNSKLTLIPYYAWCHRGKGDMAVWLPQDVEAAHPSVWKGDALTTEQPDETLTIYRPEKPNGIAVLICPGGGYGKLAMDHEGRDVARWLGDKGYTCGVLKYHLPAGHNTVPISDSQAAMRYLRENASRLGISGDSIGIMGFSAGGHLAASTATLSDSLSRPNFQILIYPVISMDPTITHKGSRNNLIGLNPEPELVERYSADRNVDENTPPAIIVLSADDKTVDPENSLRYFKALRRNGIPASMFIYPTGKHGWGMKENFRYKREWKMELEKWLENLKKK